MKRQIYNYKDFRISKITRPEYRHLLLLLGWVWYFSMYVITENMIPESACHVVHCIVDDWIPFVEYFVIAYVFWYLLVFGSLLYFLLFDVESFRRLQIFIIVTQVIAVMIYIIWPSVQYLRPAEFPRQNIFTWILQIIYSVDTPTGVCPSLHVAYSLGILSAWMKKRDTGKAMKVFVAISVLLICLAVNFVKQHSFLDVVAALPVCLVAEIIAFGKVYWMKRRKKQETE